MRYAYVKDGQVVEGPRALPSAWENTSGFNLLSQEELREKGWLPWILVEVPCPGPEWAFDTPTVVISEIEIVETQTYRLKTQQEIADEAASKAESARRARAEAYKQESDPLFFKAERGEATREDWLAKVEEIRSRYPE